MKLRLIAIGQSIPEWAETACSDYARRLNANIALEIKVLKVEPRNTGRTVAQLQIAEQRRIEAAIGRDTRIVALDERGQSLRTTQLAERLQEWRLAAQDVALIIGGPDGLHPDLLKSAHERLRLSDLTLPHALARVVLLEQLYRAWSLTAGHPYHRE